MNEIIIDAEVLPEPLLSLADSKKLSVKKDAGIITLSPASEAEEKTANYISELRGSLRGKGLTVEKFLEMTREDKKLEDGNDSRL